MLKRDSKFNLLELGKSFSYNKSCSEIATFAELTATHAAPYVTSATAGCNRKWYFSQGAPQRCSFVVGWPIGWPFFVPHAPIFGLHIKLHNNCNF